MLFPSISLVLLNTTFAQYHSNRVINQYNYAYQWIEGTFAQDGQYAQERIHRNGPYLV